ncbi:MAG: glycosyltransferase family 2 protein [Ignavibacteriales bacterium]|nr:glycosyltransferase family 2 protein [Ignavibacteriales bacterium]
MLPSVDILIVNWNSGTLLSECIRSINNAVQSSFNLNRVVVIDNASNDGSLDNLENINLPLTIIRNARNLGFAKACNQSAQASEADYLLFLNPDTLLFKNSLSAPIAFMQGIGNEVVGIIGVQLIDEKNNVSRTCSRFPNTFSLIYMSLGLDRLFPKIFPGHFMTEWNHQESKVVDQVMGAYFFVRRNLFERLNGFDERFFVYFEDLDFSLRAKKIGYKIYYLSMAQVFHKGGGTSEKIKADRLFYILRSKLLFSKKHFHKFSFLIIAATTFFVEPFVRIIGSMLKNSFNDTAEIVKAYKKLITNFND